MPEGAATYAQNVVRPEADGREAPCALGDAQRLDAASAGIVRTTTERAAEALAAKGDPLGEKPGASGRGAARRARRPAAADHAGKRDARRSAAGGTAGLADAVGAAPDKAARASQAKANLRRAIEDAAVAELDDADELSGVGSAHSSARAARTVIARRRASRHIAGAAGPKRKAGRAGVRRHASMQGKRGPAAKRASMRASEANAGKRVVAGSAKAASAGGKGAVAGAASAAAAPVVGAIAGIVAFLLAVIAVSQAASALFGFWQNEASARSLEGLPAYITYEMVEEALACQEEYGHPAGCTLAQIIVESGQGDHLSGLAAQDHNLFGMKWAGGYALCDEVAGKSSWRTGEEHGGEAVTITADFISFKGDAECIRFRSRVFLQADRYAGNTLIREAIEGCDSDKMAEGLKDAGWATSSSYVESLKSVMGTYGLYRFDGMGLEDLQNGAFSGDAVVSAAYSQLGVPYVWGGATANVGLDCSGLAQYCYRQAGIPIPRTTEEQCAKAEKVPLSEARPGDILYRPGHVGIYIGGDRYIHAPHRGDVVRVASGTSGFACALRYR